MKTHSVGNKIAVNLNSLNLPVSDRMALEILEQHDVRTIEVDIQSLARGLVGKAQWKFASRWWERPQYFDCSSLTKWIYGKKGIWLPRRPLQQFEFCRQYGDVICSSNDIMVGDLVFLSSPYKHGIKTQSDEGIGHVCISVGGGDLVCATNSELGKGIVEVSIETVLKTRKLRAIGRVCEQASSMITLMFPSDREIETTDDVRWIILQSLS